MSENRFEQGLIEFKGVCALSKSRWFKGLPGYQGRNLAIFPSPDKAYWVLPETLSQFTGAYDTTKWEQLSTEEQEEFLKNNKKEDWKGRKIWENDTVECFDYSGQKWAGVVRYSSASSSFYVSGNEGEELRLNVFRIPEKKLKVTGSLFDGLVKPTRMEL